jgi:hypothetical protein
MKKTLLTIGLLLIATVGIAQTKIISKKCEGCNRHLYHETPIQSQLVFVDSWCGPKCLEKREFDENTVWKEKDGPALPMQDLSKIWFYDNPHEINPYALDK